MAPKYTSDIKNYPAYNSLNSLPGYAEFSQKL